MRQIFFRILGVVSFGGGLYAVYDFGRDLLPLFTQFVAGTYDLFEVCTVLSSFFLGTLALKWVGIRLITLRSFSNAWLYFAILPVVAWLQKIYDFGPIGTLDRIFTQYLTYAVVYAVVLSVVLFVHKRWFTPISHESMRHIALEKSDTSMLYELRWVILGVVLIALLFLHPSPIGETIDMIISSLVYAFNWIT